MLLKDFPEGYRREHSIDFVYPNLLEYYNLNKKNDLIITTDGYAINPYVLDELVRKIDMKLPVSKRIVRFSIEGKPIVNTIYFDGRKVVYVSDGTNNSFGGQIVFMSADNILVQNIDRTTKYYLTSNNKKNEIFSFESYR
ncbi:ribosomal protein S4E [Clostridium punense]|uniref:Ribosomal protein S4E n=1 Tax=Clostridium punense TaxID=1054297 RepID=A0ABS4KAZ8_9CLOT|nr:MULTISPECIES: DUF4362 domain-containing protein [Clostridium]EQB88427.1 hypothetical protein M918_24500 [Clostridium sp. BL8]MBP2024426.1 ribosomal protein S4E [Clostridium punense]